MCDDEEYGVRHRVRMWWRWGWPSRVRDFVRYRVLRRPRLPSRVVDLSWYDSALKEHFPPEAVAGLVDQPNPVLYLVRKDGPPVPLTIARPLNDVSRAVVDPGADETEVLRAPFKARVIHKHPPMQGVADLGPPDDEPEAA